jgi:Protein of unknown function (DUF3631)
MQNQVNHSRIVTADPAAQTATAGTWCGQEGELGRSAEVGGITGADVLDDIRSFVSSVLYASAEQIDALTLACAVTHSVESFSTVPRLLFTSPEAQSGKTTGLDVVTMLSNNAWEADATVYALRAKFAEPERPTIVVDEISDVFGKSGLRGQSNPLGGVLRKGYRASASMSMAVDRTATDVSCYSVAAMAGLKTACPGDIRSRCIIFRMRPLPDTVEVADSQDSDTQALGGQYRAMLHQWVRDNAGEIRYAFRNSRRPHPKFRARRQQIWGPLMAVAQVAGGSWPKRALAAFRELALDASDMPVLSPQQTVLRDAASVFERTEAERMFTIDLAARLRDIPDRPLYSLTDRALAQLMCQGLGETTVMRIGEQRARGFYAHNVLAAWTKLEAKLSPQADDEPETDEFDSFFEVVTEGTDRDPAACDVTEVA